MSTENELLFHSYKRVFQLKVEGVLEDTHKTVEYWWFGIIGSLGEYRIAVSRIFSETILWVSQLFLLINGKNPESVG